MFHFALNTGGISAQSHCYYLSFVFPATLIWLLHCNAMHFDSFSLGARHLFQKLVLFFLCEVIPTCDTMLFSELKSLSELFKKVCNPI
jgi:hypothetical protein